MSTSSRRAQKPKTTFNSMRLCAVIFMGEFQEETTANCRYCWCESLWILCCFRTRMTCSNWWNREFCPVNRMKMSSQEFVSSGGATITRQWTKIHQEEEMLWSDFKQAFHAQKPNKDTKKAGPIFAWYKRHAVNAWLQFLLPWVEQQSLDLRENDFST